MSPDPEILGRRSSDGFILEACVIKHDDIDRRLANLELMLEKVSNRPPVWTTVVISVLTMFVGALLGKVI